MAVRGKELLTETVVGSLSAVGVWENGDRTRVWERGDTSGNAMVFL